MPKSVFILQNYMLFAPRTFGAAWNIIAAIAAADSRQALIHEIVTAWFVLHLPSTSWSWMDLIES